jgi:MOSC domain-containing protein YiiM
MKESARIHQINISNGGVPKLPVPSADVSLIGLANDYHEDKVHHGGPTRAVSIYSLELIKALQAEGHPIYPGSTGENITISGLDWSRVIAGLRLRLGDDVEIEVTQFASPCTTIRESFLNDDFSRISWRTHSGWARAYARVLLPGQITVGDALTPID